MSDVASLVEADEAEDILDAWSNGVPSGSYDDSMSSFITLEDSRESIVELEEPKKEEEEEEEEGGEEQEAKEEEASASPLLQRGRSRDVVVMPRARQKKPSLPISVSPRSTRYSTRKNISKSARSSPRNSSRSSADTSAPPLPLPDMPEEALRAFQSAGREDTENERSSGGRKSLSRSAPRGSRMSRKSPRSIRKLGESRDQMISGSVPNLNLAANQSRGSSRFSLSRSPRKSPRMVEMRGQRGGGGDESPKKNNRRSFAQRRSKSMFSLPRAPSGEQEVASSGDLAEGGLFGMTLKDVMSRQQESGDFSSLVPQIMTELIDGVFNNGGMQHEGIFRLSITTEVKAEAMQSLHDFEPLKDYKDPHVFAVLLKEWLKRLGEPLVDYATFIQVAKDAEDEGDIKGIAELWEKMPDLNQEVVRKLMSTIRRMDDEEFVKKTKMNWKNFCIVFAPGIVRTTAELSPLDMLRDQPLQQKAMEMLYLWVCENQLD